MRTALRGFIAALAFVSLGSAAPNACKGANWDSSLVIDLRSKGTEGCTKTEAWDYKGPQVIKKTSKLPSDGHLVKQSGRSAGGPYTCDHVVELAMIRRIMELPGGACDQAEILRKGGATDGLLRLREIRLLANARSNMYFFHEKIETFKGTLVNFLAGIKGTPNIFTTITYWEANALNDFAVGAGRPGSKALATAKAIDKEILKQFPKAATTDSVEAQWLAWVAAVKVGYSVLEAKAQQELKDLQCTPPSSPKPLQAFAQHSPRPRMVGARSIFTPYSSGEVMSSLTVRARRSSPRSGKNAPPAASCPMKNQPQKKTVPKSKAPTRPPPAKKPRQPAARPRARPPTGKKQAAKRPATRPRRQPGKPAPQRRASPKRKPKPVPKPTRRPKGKARPRRRK